jgi:hypothetical protein
MVDNALNVQTKLNISFFVVRFDVLLVFVVRFCCFVLFPSMLLFLRVCVLYICFDIVSNVSNRSQCFCFVVRFSVSVAAEALEALLSKVTKMKNMFDI